MSKTQRALATALSAISMFFLMAASPCWARLNVFDGLEVVEYPNSTYDATVRAFQCSATQSTEWINRPVIRDSNPLRDQFFYPSGIMSGHNVYPQSNLGVGGSRLAGLPRITDTEFVLHTSVPANSGASAGYRVNITRIDGRSGSSSDFRELVVRFNPHGTSLSNIRVRAIPQNRQQSFKTVSFNRLQVVPDQTRVGWYMAKATVQDLGLVNNTFCNFVDAYQIAGTNADQIVEFGRFDVRHTYAWVLDRVTVNLNDGNCPL